MSDPDDLPPDLRAALLDVGRAAEALHDPWWIFGGAALALYGMEALHVPDVDVLCSPRDARRLIQALGGEIEPDPGEGLFRSRVFGHATPGRMRIEVMAEMDVRSGGDWTPWSSPPARPLTFPMRRATPSASSRRSRKSISASPASSGGPRTCSAPRRWKD